MNKEGTIRVIRADGRSDRLGATLMSVVRTAPQTATVGLRVAIRELQADFRENKLGFLWLFITPLMYVAAFVAIRNGLESRGLSTTDGPVPGAVFALAGLIVFQTWFDSALTQLTVFSKNQSLIKNIGIEPETFLYAGIAKSLALAAPKLLLLCGAMALMRVETFSWASYPGYVVVLVAACLSGSMTGYLLSPFGAVMNDVKMALQSASLALLLGSAVFFDADTFSGGWAHVAFGLNPIACIVDAARFVLFGGPFTLKGYAAGWLAASAALLPFSMVFTRLSRRIVAERL